MVNHVYHGTVLSVVVACMFVVSVSACASSDESHLGSISELRKRGFQDVQFAYRDNRDDNLYFDVRVGGCRFEVVQDLEDFFLVLNMSDEQIKALHQKVGEMTSDSVNSDFVTANAVELGLESCISK